MNIKNTKPNKQKGPKNKINYNQKETEDIHV